MALNDAFEYLFKNDLLHFNEKIHESKLKKSFLETNQIEISIDLESIIEEVEDDLQDCSETTPAILFFEYKNNVFIPCDYYLKDDYEKSVKHDDDIYIQCTLLDVLKVFEMIDDVYRPVH